MTIAGYAMSGSDVSLTHPDRVLMNETEMSYDNLEECVTGR